MSAVIEGPGEGSAGSRRGGVRAQLRGLSWRSATISAAFGVAFISWLPVFLVCGLAWIVEPGIGLGALLVASARAWLLANGVPAHLDGGVFFLVPLGFTAIIGLLVGWLSRTIARRAADELIEGPVRARRQSDLRSLSCRLALWSGCSYALILVVVTILAGQPAELSRALVNGLLIGGGCSLLASGRALGWEPVSLSQGGWSTGVLAGVLAGLAGIVLVGCARLAAVLVVNRAAITGVHDLLGAGGPGSVLLSVVQMLWVPSMVIWSCSWVLGAGFSLGQGAFIAPLGSSTGPLPQIPLLVAMSTGDAHPAMIVVWLLLAATAGALGAHICVRARCDEARRALPEREPGADEGALYGLLVGVLAGLLLCLLAVFSHGALGTQRLAAMGPELGRLLVLAPTVLGAGGMLGGFLTARRRERGAANRAAAG
ncbi:cell division protein PerM [Propionibacterium australiense]|uniref:Uncharacterized protein n=1 Tax=Propionibacterium australiense TaxID=119981 RepID=A0A383S508_9ACTN|nr:DUF6350 family protein [Propionibacterium australiense]RLP10575.1 hypothetical protein D9T14_04805 [Propionibacterium australiense]RLP12870.1 hypothetical protein D7U36_00050 [Propionibacterium australiense]SYZ32771.1 Hypothetical protein PROPAUS_0678 [Propionibacterium australiense]VEH91284.1 Uncharacterised protein [Propionibacterium australiense]